MGLHERSIKIAFNKATKETLDAEEMFWETKNAFQIRKEYHGFSRFNKRCKVQAIYLYIACTLHLILKFVYQQFVNIKYSLYF